MFPVVLITIIAITLKKYVLSKDYRFFYVGLLILNFLCLVAPDKMVYKLRKNHRYFWSEKPLDISHFKIRINDESDIAAEIFPILVGEINRVYNYPPAILFTSDQIGRSWIDTTFFENSFKGKKELQQLLQHEKLHLDINKIYSLKAQDSLNKMMFSSYTEKYQVIEFFFNVSDSIQDAFDSETNHGLDEEQSEKWNTSIQNELSKSF